ncbi:MAG: polysaccharide ABC transporter ATP-binding protein [Flavobacteriaceae bacterium]
MSNKDVILKVENLSKQYRIGTISTGTISHDLNRWWHKIRGQEDPYLKIGETNDRSSKGESEYVWALKDINFEVKRGEVLGIIGKNGAGKSTLLKILSKVTSPTTGSIKTKGRIASLLEVGTGFHPEMTGKENIFLNGAILGMTKKEIKAKFDEIVEFSGCERYIDTPVKRYSSGMKVRLAFAVAAFLEPDILVVDEVLAVGDAEFQKKAIGKMQDISQGEGRTVLFVSHDMGAVQNLCTCCVVLNSGRTVFYGDVKDSVSNYLSDRNNRNESKNFGNNIELEKFEINGLNYKEITLDINEKVCIHVVFNNSEVINNYIFEIKLKSKANVVLATLSTYLVNPNSLKARKEINCVIDKGFSLVPGKYFLNLVLVDKFSGNVSEISDLAEVNVVDSENSINGNRVKPRFHGYHYSKYVWFN